MRMSETTLSTTEARAVRQTSGPRRFLQRYGWSYVFIAPSMLMFLLFILIPALSSLVIAFLEVRLRGESTWVGFNNFREAFTTQSGVFVRAIGNTLFYTVVTVTANVLIALIISALIQPLGR